MKFKNRIMSWILSPGAYALWHSMGNPEEWSLWDGMGVIHRQHYHLKFDLGFNAPWILRVLFVWWMRGFFFDTWDDDQQFMGYFERHLVVRRACSLHRKLKRIQRRQEREKHMSARKKRNFAVFTRLTVNE